jgi:hypothetical protein
VVEYETAVLVTVVPGAVEVVVYVTGYDVVIVETTEVVYVEVVLKVMVDAGFYHL